MAPADAPAGTDETSSVSERPIVATAVGLLNRSSELLAHEVSFLGHEVVTGPPTRTYLLHLQE